MKLHETALLIPKINLQFFADADMPYVTNATKAADMIIPEVLADVVMETYKEKVRFTGIADVDNTLVGRAGDTLTFPAYGVLNPAEDVPEGELIPVEKLVSTSKSVKVKKAGKGVSFTDEALLGAFGNQELTLGSKAIGAAIAQKVDNDLVAALGGATQTVSIEATLEGVSAALDIFNDEDDEPVYLFLNPKDAAALRLEAGTGFLAGTEIGADMLIKGVYGDVLGAKIVRSRKVTAGEGFLVKAGALRLVMKRDVLIEPERIAARAMTALYGTEHYAAYLYDESKVVKLTITAPVAP